MRRTRLTVSVNKLELTLSTRGGEGSRLAIHTTWRGCGEVTLLSGSSRGETLADSSSELTEVTLSGHLVKLTGHLAVCLDNSLAFFYFIIGCLKTTKILI